MHRFSSAEAPWSGACLLVRPAARVDFLHADYNSLSHPTSDIVLCGRHVWICCGMIVATAKRACSIANCALASQQYCRALACTQRT